ncbi:MAG TPA: surface-adhesin E family protein [Pyrinomonadaceae bacterium]|nr:surface-adhesin E family protein [Pyrinomonadaceae bacterium]
MRLALVLLVLLFSSTVGVAQPLPEWYRVYTFDDSIIEMNTSLLTAISKDVTRVRFRWTFAEPQVLKGTSPSNYQSKLEVMEFDCSQNLARSYHVTFLSADGSIVRIDDTPGEWQTVPAGRMLQKLFVPACDLVKQKTIPADVEPEKVELERVAVYAHEISQHLEKTKDFQSIIDQFFVDNYLKNYLEDKDQSWFPGVNRSTLESTTPRDLQRFYVALMNSGYVGSLYLIGRHPSDFPDRASIEQLEKLVTPDVWQLILNHPYTAAYKHNDANYDFFSQQITGIQQLLSYTDLLEKTVSLMRQHVRNARVENSKEYLEIAESWNLYQPKVRVCTRNCLGLPSGTKLFAVNIPFFSLQIAEIVGQLRIVSARHTFQ